MPLRQSQRQKIVTLGIDPGTSVTSPLTAVYMKSLEAGPHEVFQGHLKEKKAKKGEEKIEREPIPYRRLLPLYAEFRKWLAAGIQLKGDEKLIVVLEAPLSVQNGNTTIMLAQINLLIQMAICQMIELVEGRIIIVGPGTWKKVVLGKGNFKKGLILKEVYKKWKLDFTSDDEADAYCLARYGFLV